MSGRVRIDWRHVRPELLPEGSAVRDALEDGRPEIAEWLANTYPGGARLYVHSDGAHRRFVFGERVRRAVAFGLWSASRAARRFGLNRKWLSQDGEV